MNLPRIALLDASDTESTRRNFRRELDADLVEYDPNEGDLPETFDFDGVVVTGSPYSVYWNESWIPDLIDWIAEAADADLPILGVCYGHQALAEALGGRVAGMDDYEIGYRTVEHLDNDELFAGIDERFTVFLSHSDTVAELPPGAKLLAENDFGVQAFRKGRCWGVQFHPEYDTDTAREITRRKDFSEERTKSVLDDIDADNYAAACETKQLFDSFVSYVRGVAAESPPASPAQ